MKKLRCILLVLAGAFLLTGCTLYEEQWRECIPLPSTDVEVEPEPWDPNDPQGGDFGE